MGRRQEIVLPLSAAGAGKGLWTRMRPYWPLYFFVLPAVLIRFVFAYIPMFSNVIAFMDYELFEGWMGLGSKWVGLKNFQRVLTNPVALGSITRTFQYSVYGLVFGFLPPIILALLINELRSMAFKKLVQTVSYIPHFVSWVTVAGLLYVFLTVDTEGVVNTIKVALFGGPRIPFLLDSKNFLPLLILSGIWKEVGWGSILYLAAIAGIDPQLYEASCVDGAGRWRQMWHITVPGLLPTTIVLLIFSLGRVFNSNFDQVFNLQNPVIQGDTYTIDVYAYYKGIVDRMYSTSAALAFFQGVLAFVLTLGANWLSKKVSETAII